jgi:hypothetical protein
LGNVTDKNKKRSKLLSEKYKGSGNPFFGKKHSDQTISKIVNNRDLSKCKTDEFRQKMSKISYGKNNPMYGKNFYDIWVKKYGKEEADNRMKEFNKKQSLRTSGKNNPMYGRPSPQGSGNGWSGWYKGWYFRSLKELSYMINVIEKKNIKWKSAEKDINIKYINYNGKERTYHPDFLLEDKVLIEIKPRKLMETPANKLKKEAALKYCEENNIEYRMVDVKILKIEELRNLYNSGQIIFTKKYEEKYQEYI